MKRTSGALLAGPVRADSPLLSRFSASLLAPPRSPRRYYDSLPRNYQANGWARGFHKSYERSDTRSRRIEGRQPETPDHHSSPSNFPAKTTTKPPREQATAKSPLGNSSGSGSVKEAQEVAIPDGVLTEPKHEAKLPPKALQSAVARNSWSVSIARLGARFGNTYNDRTTGSRSHYEILPQEKRPEWLPPSQGTLSSWRASWMSHSDEFKAQNWPAIMIWLLRPPTWSKALSFLLATASTTPLPDTRQVVNVLDLVSVYANHEPDARKRSRGIRTLAKLTLLLRQRHGPVFHPSQRTLHILMKRCPKEQLPSLYQALVAEGVTMDYEIVLEFARDLALRSASIESSLDALSVCLDRHGGLNPGPDSPFRKVCGNILKASLRSKGQGWSKAVLSRLQNLGVVPDIAMLNMLMNHASTRGDYDTAWRIYDALGVKGLDADAYTYTTILKMCRKSNDFHAFRRVHQDIRSQQLENPGTDLSPIVVAEILFSFFAFWPNDRAKRRVMFYKRHCSLQPLQDLGIVPEMTAKRLHTWQYRRGGMRTPGADYVTPHGPRPAPATQTLAVMILAETRTLRNPKSVLNLYERFQERLAARDPIFVPLAASDMIWNAFFKGILHNDYTSYWPSILKDMARPFDRADKRLELKSRARSWARDRPDEGIRGTSFFNREYNSEAELFEDEYVDNEDLQAIVDSSHSDVIANAEDGRSMASAEDHPPPDFAASDPRAVTAATGEEEINNLNGATTTNTELFESADGDGSATSDTTYVGVGNTGTAMSAPRHDASVKLRPSLKNKMPGDHLESGLFEKSDEELEREDPEFTPLQPPINRDTGKPFVACSPSVITCNIILHALSREGNIAEADRIIELMQSNNIEQDQVTWTSMLSTMARGGHSDRLLEALDRFQEQGWEYDEAVLRAVKKRDPYFTEEILHRVGLGKRVKGSGGRKTGSRLPTGSFAHADTPESQLITTRHQGRQLSRPK